MFGEIVLKYISADLSVVELSVNMHCLWVQIVPKVVAMAFSILWLSWVRAGVRCLSHTTFIYYTEKQTGGEAGMGR